MGGSGRHTWSGRAFLFLPHFFLPSSRGQGEEETTKREDTDGVWTEKDDRKEKTTKPNDETKF